MEKKNVEYLALLRKVMKEKGIDAVIITGTDPHQSEIPPHHWRGREWLTGFESGNGTNGTAVVLQDEALCWTDSRYFIQAENQLQGTGFKMMKEDGPEAVDLIDWVTEHLNEGQTVGIDGMTFSVSFAQRLQQQLNDNGIKLNTDFPQFDYIYPDRPARPDNKSGHCSGNGRWYSLKTPLRKCLFSSACRCCGQRTSCRRGSGKCP